MSYTIELSYSTGDTFQTYDTTGRVEITWEDLEVCKKALERIRTHEIARRRAEGYMATKADLEAYKNTPGYTGEYTILLPMDDGSEQSIYAFWYGYFENLYGGQIVTANEAPDGLSFYI